MRSATRYRVKTSYTLTAQRHQIFLDGKTCARSTVHQLSSLLQGVPSSCLQSITGLWHSAFLINPTTPRAALACHTFAAKCLDATSLQGLSWNCIWPLLPLCPNPGRNTVYNWGWEAEWKLRSLLFLCNLVYLAPPHFCDILNNSQLDRVQLWSQFCSSIQKNRSLAFIFAYC